MVVVSEDGGELDYDLSDDDILVQFDITIPTYVPVGNEQQEAALKRELARLLWWDPGDIKLTRTEIYDNASGLGLPDKCGVKPDYETCIEGTYYVD